MPYVLKKKGTQTCVHKQKPDKTPGSEVSCHASRPDAVKAMRALYANEKADLASDQVLAVPCMDAADADCARSFLDFEAMVDHAEAVHTFDDIRAMVSEEIREKYNVRGDYRATPPVPSVWAWVADLADDWVVFEASQGSQCDNYKCGYSIVDNVATLGEISEVRRRTVWEPVGANEPAGILSTSKENN